MTIGIDEDLDWVRFERAFRSLLWRVRPRHLQRGIEVLRQRAEIRASCGIGFQPVLAGWKPTPHASEALGCPWRESLERVYQRARDQTIQHLVRRRESRRTSTVPFSWDNRSVQQTLSVFAEGIPQNPSLDGADFYCDSGLGGLARWLRAAGYDARFWPYIDDSELIRESTGSSAILLTTDQPLMSRSAITWGVVPALHVPMHLGKRGQFDFVSERLTLPRKSPRCMQCGGKLARVGKESVRSRIPPRTFPWLDEYYECLRCGKLLWPGTHWQRVAEQLAPR